MVKNWWDFKICLLMAAFVLPLSLFIFFPVVKAENDDRKQTIMIYMTGSDLESNSGAATRDIMEMLRARHDSEQTTVLVMIGGSRKWRSFPSDQSVIYEIKGNRPEEQYAGDLRNMGDADTLSFFLGFCVERYPAERYALILWDHGGGPLEGVCFDECFRNERGKDGLSLREIKYALENSIFSSQKLEWIGFDACLMSSIEVASVCAPYAEYMVASEEIEPGSGWNYRFLKEIEGGMDGLSAGKKIIDAYFDNSESLLLSQELTLACINLSMLKNSIQEVSDAFDGMIHILTEESFPQIVKNVLSAKSVGRSVEDSSSYDLVDLIGLLDAIPENGIKVDESSLLDCISYARSSVDGLHGLSIFYPYYNQKLYNDFWKEAYEEICFSEAYENYLKEYCAIWLGEPLATWDQLSMEIEEAEEGRSLSSSLTENQLNQLTDVMLYVLQDESNNRYLFSSQSNDAFVDEKTVRAVDHQKTIVCSNIDRASGPLLYNIIDGKYVFSAIVSQKGMLQSLAGGEEINKVWVICEAPDQEGWLQINRVQRKVDGEEILVSGKNDIDLHDYAFISFVQPHICPIRDEEGQLLPFDEWERTGFSGFEIHLPERNYQIPLRMVDCEKTGMNYAYCYEFRDAQGRKHVTEIATLEQKSSERLRLGDHQNQIVYNVGGSSVKLVGAELKQGISRKGLELNFELYRANEKPKFVHAQININDCLINTIPVFEFDRMMTGTTMSYSVLISQDELEKYGITRIEEVAIDTTVHNFDYAGKREIINVHDLDWIISSTEKEPSCSLPIASAKDNMGVLYEILDVSEDYSNGNIAITFKVENNSGEYLRLNNYDILIDNIFSGKSLESRGDLAPGCKVIETLTIPNSLEIINFFVPEELYNTVRISERFSWPVIEEISCITLYNGDHIMYDEQPTIVKLDLQNPMKYRCVDAEQKHVDSFNTQIGDDHVSLSIQKAYRNQSYLILEVLMENKVSNLASLHFSLMKDHMFLPQNAGIYLEEYGTNHFRTFGKGVCRGVIIVPLSDEEWQNETVRLEVKGEKNLKELFDVGVWTIPIRKMNGQELDISLILSE